MAQVSHSCTTIHPYERSRGIEGGKLRRLYGQGGSYYLQNFFCNWVLVLPCQLIILRQTAQNVICSRILNLECINLLENENNK